MRDPDWFEPDAERQPGDIALAHRLRRERLEDGNNRRFYKQKPWRTLKGGVISQYRHACGDCDSQEPRLYRRAQVVHHVLHVSTYPQYALSEFVWGTDGVLHRNLVPVCGHHHAVRHQRTSLGPIAGRAELLEANAESRRKAHDAREKRKSRGIVTDERW